MVSAFRFGSYALTYGDGDTLGAWFWRCKEGLFGEQTSMKAINLNSIYCTQMRS